MERLSYQTGRRATWGLVTAAAACVLAGSPLRAHGSQILAMDLPALSARAERIVVAEVVAMKSAWDKDRKRILSTIELQVHESWKGGMPRDRRVTIVQAGGTADGIEMRVHGMPAFSPGERTVLFLRGAATNSVVGMGQGKRSLRLDSTTNRWLAAPPDRSAAVFLTPDGKTKPAPVEIEIPLDELRSRVRALLGK